MLQRQSFLNDHAQTALLEESKPESWTFLESQLLLINTIEVLIHLLGIFTHNEVDAGLVGLVYNSPKPRPLQYLQVISVTSNPPSRHRTYAIAWLSTASTETVR